MRSIGLYVFISSFLLCTVLANCRPVSWPCGGLLLVLSTAVLIVRARTGVRKTDYCFLFLFAGSLAILRLSLIPNAIPEQFIPLLNESLSLQGTVVALPDIRETSARITVDVTQDGVHTRIIASTPLYPVVSVGDRVIVAGKLKLPASFETDGGRTFDYPNFLRKDGVYAVIQPASVQIVGRSSSLWLRILHILEYIKDTFIRYVGAVLPEPESALAVGIIVGGKQGLGVKLLDDFGTAGMLQIVVLSGYNVMIVANTILALLARLPKKISATIAATSIALFVFLAGAGSSALRAGVMALFAILARAIGKRYDVLRIVYISVFLLTLWNPLMLLYDPGFQFSCIATLGLILGVPVVAPRLLFLRSKLLIELVSTTLAAELFLLPLLLWQTGNLSIVSLPANVVAMPVLPFAMAASSLAAFVSPMLNILSPVLLSIIGIPAYVPLWYVIHVATFFSSLPFATILIPAFPFWVVVVAYGVIGAVLVREYKKVPTPLESALLHL